ncbi:MAG: translation elongation factor 4, partial [Candidatus Paceibacteria bacterium]
MSQQSIRNFVIIAHVDHGKSTLADRFLELTGTVSKRDLKEQFLDQMELERERGITIKMQPVRMVYHPHREITQTGPRKSAQVENYVLNLIDTPGHVDFSYEVSRSLAAVEGAILLVDATQGIQAQTISNFNLAKKEGLKIIGALTKIDLNPPYIAEIEKEVADLIGIEPKEILRVSGKTGEGIRTLLDAVISKIPAPKGDTSKALRALVFDSSFDPYRGVIAYVKIVDGSIKKGDKFVFCKTRALGEVLEVGIFTPELKPKDELFAGEIGYIATGIKEPNKVRVGDTLTKFKIQKIEAEPLPGYSEPQPVVFASFFPAGADDFQLLEDALSKLKLNDASFTFSAVRHSVLGQGFKIGCLGSLHLEIVKERLLREYGLELVITFPSVMYRVVTNDKKIIDIHTPQELPPLHLIKSIQEPWVKGTILTPPEYLGQVISLIQNSRGYINTTESLVREIILNFELPLGELIVDFYDRLKSITRGYGSLSYEVSNFKPGDLVKVDILVAGKVLEAFSRIIPRHSADSWGRATIEKLKEILPREVFPVPIQAAIGSKIIARVTLPALKKDVTGHLYGGDRTR